MAVAINPSCSLPSCELFMAHATVCAMRVLEAIGPHAPRCAPTCHSWTSSRCDHARLIHRCPKMQEPDTIGIGKGESRRREGREGGSGGAAAPMLLPHPCYCRTHAAAADAQSASRHRDVSGCSFLCSATPSCVLPPRTRAAHGVVARGSSRLACHPCPSSDAHDPSMPAGSGARSFSEESRNREEEGRV